MKILCAALAVAALLYVPVSARHALQAPADQAIDVSGEWKATVAAPRGALEYTMYLNQQGPRLTGYFQSEYGEIPLRGSLKGDAITLSWTLPDAKEPIDCTMAGTVKGDVISGEATLARVGKGPFQAERSAG